MASKSTIVRNLGKSVAYSSMNVMGGLNPQSADLGRATLDGITMTRDFMRSNMSRLKVTTAQIDKTTVNRKARMFLDDALADIRKGNISLGELYDDFDDDIDAFYDDDDGGRVSSDDEDESEGQQSSSRDTVATMAAVANVRASQRNVEAMKHLGSSITTATLNAAEYQTSKITSTLIAQMSANAEHYKRVDAHLSNISHNVLELVKFQNDSQGRVNQAQLSFFDQMSRHIDRQNKQREKMNQRTNSSRRRVGEGFLADSAFDVSDYKAIVKDNFAGSELGMLTSMMGMLDKDTIGMMLGGGTGKIQPQKLLLEAIMRAAVPRKARQDLSQGDSEMGSMIKTALTRFGNKRYSSDNPLVSMLSGIFGIDSRVGRTMNIGKYKKNEMNWNGEAQRALTVVIPKELAEIKAAILKTDAKYHDSATGKFFTEGEIIQRSKREYQDTVGSPFVNMFGNYSKDRISQANRKLWEGLDADSVRELNKFINQGVSGDNGVTENLSDAIDALLRKANAKNGGSSADTRRMANMITKGINESRGRQSEFIKRMQEEQSAFSQIAPDIANQYGNINHQQLAEYLGIDQAIDMGKLNDSASYTRGGKRLDAMGAEERRSAEKAEENVQGLYKMFRDMGNSQNKHVARVGKGANAAYERFVLGSGGEYSNRASDMVNGVFNRIYEETMLSQSGRGNARAPYNPMQDITGVYDAPDYPSPGVPYAAMFNNPAFKATARRNGMQSDGGIVNAKMTGVGGTRLKYTNPYNVRMPQAQNFVPQGVPQFDPEVRVGKYAQNYDMIYGAGNARLQYQRSDGGVVNEEMTDRESMDPAGRTANATEEMADDVKNAMGKNSIFMKLMNMLHLDKLKKRIQDSAVGQAVGKGVSEAKTVLREIFMEDFVDEDGNVTPSVWSNIKRYASNYKDMVSETVGIDPDTGKPVKGGRTENVGDAVDNLAESLRDESETVTGEDSEASPKKKRSEIFKSLNTAIRKHAPKILTAGVLGAGASMLAGGNMGLVGSLFLPAGPVGAAIAAMGITFLSQTEGFKKLMWGEKGEDGNRQGGLISKELTGKFKKMLPAIGIGGGVAAIYKLLGGSFGPLGVVGNMLGPSGIIGAALLGSGLAIMGSSNKFKDTLFGEKDKDGKRTNNYIAKGFSQLTGGIREKLFAKDGAFGDKASAGKVATTLLKGAVGGVVTATTLSQFGILGSAFGIGGPVGAAIAGMAVSIAGNTSKFNDMLFGDMDEKGEKRNRNGLISRFQTMLQLHVGEPLSNWASHTAEQFGWWMKEKMEVPFRLAFDPILNSFSDLKDVMKDGAKELFKKATDTLVGGLQKLLSPILGLTKKLMGGVAKAGGSLIKGGLFATGSIASAPLQLLSMMMSKKRREGQKEFGTFLKDNREDNLESYWANEAKENDGKAPSAFSKAGDKAMYSMATMPLLGKFFRNNEMMSDMAAQYGEEAHGYKNYLGSLSAITDRKEYKRARKMSRKDEKSENKLSKLRRSWGKEDGYNKDVIWTNAQVKQRINTLKAKKIDIKDEDELRKFTYNYDAWKNPEKYAEKDPDSETAKNTSETVSWLQKTHAVIGDIKDAVTAMFDMQSGETFDSDDLQAGETLADEVDEEFAAKVQENAATKQATVIQQTLNAQKAQDLASAKVETKHEEVTGLDGGLEPDAEPPSESTGTTESSSSDSSSSSLLSSLSDSASSYLASFLTSGVGVAAIVAGLLGTSVGQDFISGLATGIGNVASSVWSNMTGTDGGFNDSRATSFDEDGNVTSSIANYDVAADVASIATSSFLGQTVINAADAASGNTIANAVSSVSSVVDDVVAKVATTATSTVATAVATTADNATTFQKIIKYLATAFDSVGNSLLGKIFSKCATAFKGLATFLDDVASKVISKGLATKWGTKLTAASAVAAGTTASAMTPAVVINIAMGAVGAIYGACEAEQLFNCNEDDLDATMRSIAAVFEGVTAFSGAAAILSIINEIVTELLGIDILQQIAITIYNGLTDDEAGEALEQAISDFQQEVDNYNEANGTSISASAYNDLKNKSWLGTAWNNIASIWGGSDTTDYTQYEVGNYTSSSSTGYGSTVDNLTSSATGYGRARGYGRKRGYGKKKSATGYGHYRQNDSRWGNQTTGNYANGTTAVMADAGCGPTALANAFAAIGEGTPNPGDITKYALGNGMMSEGGANDNLFDYGVAGMGADSTRVSTQGDIIANLAGGNPVVMAGTTGSGTPYTDAGHIVTATGFDTNGKILVQDPLQSSTQKYNLSDMQNHMTAGWAIGSHVSDVEPTSATGYGLFDNLFSSLQSKFYSLLGISNSSSTSTTSTTSTSTGSTSTGYSTTFPTTSTNFDASDHIGQVSAQFESSGDPSTVSGGVGDAGGVSFGTYQFTTGGASEVSTSSSLYKFWKQYYMDQYPDAIPGNNTNFIEAWQHAATNDPSFQANEYQFMLDNYYKVAKNKLTGFDPDSHSRAAQEAVWSTATQYGMNSSLLNNALGSDSQNLSATELVNKIQDYKADTISNYFSKCSSAVQASVKNRHDVNERNALLSIGDTGPTGYGILDTLFGGFGESMMSKLYAALGLSYNDSSSSSTTTSTGSTGVTSNLSDTASNSEYQSQTDLANKMASVMGNIRYSTSEAQNIDNGVGSCASTVGWAYDKVLGVNGMSASSTAQSKDERFKTIWENDGSGDLDTSKLQPGDLMYMNWDQTKNNGAMKHTEMYVGNGQDLSHGGSGAGPTIKTLSDSRKANTMMVRRYIPYVEGTAGYGKGQNDAFGLNSTGQYVSDSKIPTVGYGPNTATTTTSSSNAGVETRLDTIITLMQKISDSSATGYGKATTSMNNVQVNYGTGDKETTTPVIIQQKQETPSDTVVSPALREKHSQMASMSRFR